MYQVTRALAGRLFAWTILVAMSGFISMPVYGEAELCAVTLYVVSPDYKPLVTRVEVLSPSGRIELSTVSMTEGLRICDLEFGPHQIVIPPALDAVCFPTTISNVQVLKGNPIELHVIVNPCSHYAFQSTGCRLYFRVRSSTGEKIGATTIWPAFTGEQAMSGKGLQTDRFGRAWTLMVPSMTVHFLVSHEGYIPRGLDVTCHEPAEPIEREVILTPQVQNGR